MVKYLFIASCLHYVNDYEMFPFQSNFTTMARPGELPPLTTEELACIYSAAILADDDIPVTQEKLSTILKAADVDVSLK